MSAAIRDKQAADAFAALGNRTRLRVLRLLVKAGDDGLNVGELQALSKVPASTLAHHLATLVKAGVVRREKHGREVIHFAVFERLRSVSAYLLEDCCAGVLGCSHDSSAA